MSVNVQSIVPQNPSVYEVDIPLSVNVVKHKYPEFLYTERQLARIHITDHSNRYPYLDLPNILADFDTLCDNLWIETMPVQAYVTCYLDDAQTIIDLLHRYSGIEAGYSLRASRRHEDDVYELQYTYDTELVCRGIGELQNHDVVSLNWEVPLVRLKNPHSPELERVDTIPIENPYRGDAYIFPEGCLVRRKYNETDRNWYDLSGATVTNPVLESTYNLYEVQFPVNRETGVIKTLYYTTEPRAALVKNIVDCTLPHVKLLAKNGFVNISPNGH